MTTPEASFATFGDIVELSDVPALVRAGVDVYSFGYDEDYDEDTGERLFTTLNEDDLWAFEGDDSDRTVVASWAPFRADSATKPATARDLINEVIEEHKAVGNTDTLDLSGAILMRLAARGFEVLAPQDLEWGICPMAEVDGGPHRISTSLCAGCLEYDPE